MDEKEIIIKGKENSKNYIIKKADLKEFSALCFQ